ncbi:hypothetical protein [Colwellia sp. BRX10-4]|jgi:hypothetical protein|uniref:hypothetical protein n=1 Tax=Colwellia sp. BRX10-4 TaxID=2759843 RepID=UPI0015F42242|nr:hypothetical protein [Colwellia sp. BRX10-4]MBA6397588.1 hypothetical protein [Colwellia sp. BRX10-4]
MKKNILVWLLLMASIAFSSIATENKQSIETVLNEIPVELHVTYQQYQNILNEIKLKADAQTSEKRTQRIMRFHEQYKNSFDKMPPQSKVDMLKILKTGDKPTSKLKGQRLLDKASEYITILNKPYSSGNAVILNKYNQFITKFNPNAGDVLSHILSNRLPKNYFELVYSDKLLAESEKSLAESKKFRAESKKSLAESEKLLQVLLALKKATTKTNK